jgi:hypothetical protein
LDQEDQHTAGLYFSPTMCARAGHIYVCIIYRCVTEICIYSITHMSKLYLRWKIRQGICWRPSRSVCWSVQPVLIGSSETGYPGSPIFMSVPPAHNLVTPVQNGCSWTSRTRNTVFNLPLSSMYVCIMPQFLTVYFSSVGLK